MLVKRGCTIVSGAVYAVVPEERPGEVHMSSADLLLEIFSLRNTGASLERFRECISTE